jgi:hypothetical protein
MKPSKLLLVCVAAGFALLSLPITTARANNNAALKCQKCINDAKIAAGCTAKNKDDPDWAKQECPKAVLNAKLKCGDECP